MADDTKIEWTDATWTPVRARRIELQSDGSGKERVGWHCEHASPGCINCYSESMNRWVGTGRDFKPAHLHHVTHHGDVRGDVGVFLDEEMLLQPLRWKRPRKIFVCSMTDAFADFVTDEWLDQMFAVMALAPQHTFQVLTKRAFRMASYFNNRIREALIGQQVGRLELARSGNPVSEWAGLPMPNVWLGVSVEDQTRADERIPHLLTTPARVRFLSVEPLLGPVDIDCPDIDWMLYPEGNGIHGDRLVIDWVIVGGESGRNARPMHPVWAPALRDQCKRPRTPFLFKQWGEFAPVVIDRTEFEHPKPEHVGELFSFVDGGARVEVMRRVGKKVAGRLLDGVEYNGFPV